MRGISDQNILDKFCIDFCRIVENYVQYVVVSGFVAISSGRSRATEDIDIIVEKMDLKMFNKFHNELKDNNFVCMQSDSVAEIYGYLIKNLSVRYTYRDQPLPEMELKFVKDKLDELQINEKVKLELTGLDIWFSSVNMNIAFKEELLKSEKDLKDAEHLRKIYPELVDENKIDSLKSFIRGYRL
jgi:hypothetical protein